MFFGITPKQKEFQQDGKSDVFHMWIFASGLRKKRGRGFGVLFLVSQTIHCKGAEQIIYWELPGTVLTKGTILFTLHNSLKSGVLLSSFF